MRLLLKIALLCLPLLACAQKPAKIQIIPEPVAVTAKTGMFTITANTTIAYPSEVSNMDLPARYLAVLLNTASGYKIEPIASKSKAAAKNQIFFEINPKKVKNPEGYELEASNSGIVITAANAAGAFYAVQTLRQILPAQINASTLQKGIDWTGCWLGRSALPENLIQR